MSKRCYVLTQTAECDFREARNWSLSRWGKAATHAYFQDLHDCAEQIARKSFERTESNLVAAETELYVWPIREHYLVYLPWKVKTIIIVALIRQSRDVPSILSANQFQIKRELRSIMTVDREHPGGNE